MDEKAKLLESLLESAKEYSKNSFELIKLKIIDKLADAVSSAIPFSVVIVLFASFLLFLSVGLAFWFGDLTGRIFYGFFIVAGIYIFLAVIIHFLLHKKIKRLIGDYFIRNMLK
jgi:fatty acid desaturase